MLACRISGDPAVPDPSSAENRVGSNFLDQCDHKKKTLVLSTVHGFPRWAGQAQPGHPKSCKQAFRFLAFFFMKPGHKKPGHHA